MPKELKDCPLCGNPHMDEDEGVFQCGPFGAKANWYTVRCGDPSCTCQVEGPTRLEAVRRWNRRGGYD